MGERVINLPHHRPRHLSSDNQCAAMDVQKVAAVALLLLFAGSVRCEPITYNLMEWCGQTLSVTSSMLLTVDVSARRYLTQTCQVSIFSQHGVSNNFVRLQLLKVDADCDNLSMRLYDGQGTWNPLTDAICGHVSSSTRMFVTTLSTLTINIQASGYFAKNMKFSMLATSFSLADDGFGDFQCDNYEFIASELKCDGYNNCGDRSDEDFCKIFFWPWKIAAIAGGCTAAAVIIVVVIIVVRRRSRRAQQNKNTNQAVTPIKQAGAPVLPTYGAIPGSGYQPYTTSPPPYSIVDIQVSTPPPPPTPPRAEPATPAVEGAAAGMKIN